MRKIEQIIHRIKNNFKPILVISFIVILILIEISYKSFSNKKVESKNNTSFYMTKKVMKKIKVDVKGSVNNPGVYELDENSRVIDAINASGGVNEYANTSNINLSKKITDEMVIIVYSNYQIETYKNDNKKTEYVYIEVEKCPDNMNDACISQNKSTNKKEDNNEITIVSINTASLEQLKTLPGIGESKANDIIKYREKEGNFKTIEDIKNVSGIGDSLFEKIKDYITV